MLNTLKSEGNTASKKTNLARETRPEKTKEFSEVDCDSRRTVTGKEVFRLKPWGEFRVGTLEGFHHLGGTACEPQ